MMHRHVRSPSGGWFRGHICKQMEQCKWGESPERCALSYGNLRVDTPAGGEGKASREW